MDESSPYAPPKAEAKIVPRLAPVGKWSKKKLWLLTLTPSLLFGVVFSFVWVTDFRMSTSLMGLAALLSMLLVSIIAIYTGAHFGKRQGGGLNYVLQCVLWLVVHSVLLILSVLFVMFSLAAFSVILDAF